ncbi:MAG: hypothetical protein JXR96_29840, partial [Deltaproteobacteria bacterium]|nr:hypothetical protein [Deltaproteobacteria bacterium]
MTLRTLLACLALSLCALACGSNDEARCQDADSDGHDGYDAAACPGGDDRCDADPHNWTESGCAS